MRLPTALRARARALASMLVGVTLLVLISGCGEPVDDDRERPSFTVPEPNRDAQPGGLFHDFFSDGKFDAAGHPIGAQVFDGADGCTSEIGAIGDTGIAASANLDEAGVLCAGEPNPLGAGTFTLNVRALLTEEKAPVEAAEWEDSVLEITVSRGDSVVTSRTISPADFAGPGIESDLAVTFTHRGDEPLRFEVRWTGSESVQLMYVELFRSSPQLILTPASGVFDRSAGATFEIELQDPPDELSFRVECDDLDVSGTLEELLTHGSAEWVDTEFRTVVRAPADRLFAACPATTAVRVHAMAGRWAQKTSRVTYRDEPVPCDYAGDGSTRVLLTGFEPFPAHSDADNSSQEAVRAYLADGASEGVQVMAHVLPVEYDSAPAQLSDIVARCEPDLIVGFGQGRTYVDVETTAYNRKDSAAVAGGVPDNRGIVYGGDAILSGGPSERSTELPVDAIIASLTDLGIEAGPSDDPGRYVCNNLFFTIMDMVDDDARIGGFVHLPRIPYVDDEARAMLRDVVATVVEEALASAKPAAR